MQRHELRLLHWEGMLFSVTGDIASAPPPPLPSSPSHRIVPVESGSGVSRNQAYNMVSVYGDAVLVEPSTNVDHSADGVIEKLEISIPLPPR
jgi:hypothetical protein